MATGPWDSFKPQQTEEPRGPWTQFNKASIDETPQLQQKPEPTESGGFVGSLVEALKQRAYTARPAAQLFTGTGDQKQATEELLKESNADSAFKQTEFSDIGKLFKEGRYGDALSKTADKFKEVAGSSLGSMGPAMVAGEAAGLVGGPLAGVAAFGVVSLGSYVADNIARQKQEQEKKGDKYADINRLTATTAAAGETALDVFGFKFFKPLGRLVGIEGKEASERAALEIVEAATKPKAYRNAVLKGTAEGIAFEVPQEVTQQVLERWQAGLALNPFDDPEAAKEYAEAAGGALLLGGPMGGASKVAQTYQARQTPEGQNLLKGVNQGSILDKLGKEPDVTKPIDTGVGTGVSVDQPAGGTTTAAGTEQNQPGGVVRPDTTLAPADVRENAQPSSLEDFHRQYNDLRAEMTELMSITRPTTADMNRMKLVQQDLTQLVSDNADSITAATGRPELTEFHTSTTTKGRKVTVPPLLTNPLFDGNKIIGEMATNEVADQAHATQGDMFGKTSDPYRLGNMHLQIAGGNVDLALRDLEAARQRANDKYEEERNKPMSVIKYARDLNMTPGEAASNPEAVAKEMRDRAIERIDRAIDQIKRKANPTQGDLFGAEDNKAQDEFAQQRIEQAKTARMERADEEEFGAPIEGEEETSLSEQEKKIENELPPEAKAPKEDTEHVTQTEEGATLKDFFDNIKSSSKTEGSQQRHGESKNTVTEAMLEYDIALPGETKSSGAKKMLDYLAKRVGGIDKLNELLAALRSATPDQQSRLFERNNLPDLTSRRGIDEFRDQVRQYVDSIGGTEQGVRVPTKNIPSPFYGKVIPYTETITSTGVVTQTRGPSAEGKPRRPVQATTETEHVIVDRKLRNAFLILKQALSSGKKLSPQQHAAVNYLNSTNRSTFGQALADVAYDLAYGSIYPKAHGANTTFFGEGGKYAMDFRDWIVANLDQGTVDILNDLIEEHKLNNQENKKFQKARTEYYKKLDTYSEQRRKELEKRQKVRIPRAPKKVRIGDIKEELVEPTANVKNLPTVQVVTEIHPALTRMLEQGQVREALDILANAKGNPYYAALAQRLIDTNMTAESRLIDTNTIESLNNDPTIKESLDKRLEVLRDIVSTIYPAEQQAGIISGLRSTKLRELSNAVSTMMDTIDSVGASESQKQALESAYDLLNKEYNWNGKYDPSTDQIVLRSGAGKLTNTLFLHEAIHAAASHLIDNADKLSGVQRQGYERLVELYEYSKQALQSEEFTNEFYDLHEFVSYGLTDPIFQAHLRTLGYKAAPFSLWNMFTEAIRNLFNVKKGYESNVMVEVMLAADTMLAGTMELRGINEAGGTIAGPAKPSKTKTKTRVFKPGMPNQPGTIGRMMKAGSWSKQAISEFRSMSAGARPAALGLLTLRQINDLIAGRIPQLSNFIKVTEDFLARKNGILKESGEISKEWQKLQSKDPEMSRQMGLVMHMATINEIDPDKATVHQRNTHQQLMIEWNKLDDAAKKIYRDVRSFYESRFSNYKQLMNRRIIQMRQLGVSEKTILEIRNEFEQGMVRGPYFPLMRFGRFWYEIGPTNNREYYMFETQAARDAHVKERIAKDPHLADTIGSSIGNDYKSQMDFHAQQSNFLRESFNAIDKMNTADKQALKDELYQTFLMYQPDRSMRNRFIHRQNKAGYSEDALRSFASSSFNMAYQLSRFEYSPEMFSQLEAARLQLKERFEDSGKYDPAIVRENDELNDYIGEAKRRLDLILNPTDVGTIPSMLSNLGFIYYLSSPASAITNVLGGVMIGFPTLVGQLVKLNPKMSYTQAVIKTLFETGKSAAQAIAGMSKGATTAPAGLSKVEQAAYNRFVADGLIDITATYDQSGLASTPTEQYSGARYKAMRALTFLFHQAERLNREVMAMSAFRAAHEQAVKDGLSPRAAFTKAIQDAKDATNRSMFDYSSTNKPRYFQHPVARIVLQFKQFPQQMTFFLAHNLINSIKGQTPEVRREARARFVGTMGMAGIMGGVTGLWGFSTVASVVNAVFNAMGDDDDELPFDFELAFANWAAETFGSQVGMAVTRGIPNAVTNLDIGNRVKLDDMWFPDSRKNQDQADALQSFLIETLGPTVGLGVNAARAIDLWNQGHGDRAIEAVSPSFVKNLLVAGRIGREGGATTLSGELLTENDSPFTIMMQGLGLRSAELAERQYYNITVKGEEQAILKQRQNLLNYYGLTFMANEVDANQEAFEKIMEFNRKHPTVAIPADSIISSITNRFKKSAQTNYGMYIDPRLKAQLSQQDYLANQ
jgi:hypothetical protein